jgi:hypothetical protein
MIAIAVIASQKRKQRKGDNMSSSFEKSVKGATKVKVRKTVPFLGLIGLTLM